MADCLQRRLMCPGDEQCAGSPRVLPRAITLTAAMAVMALTVLLWPESTQGAAQLKDQVGRRVRVAAPPQRVVALAPSITEIVFALGQGHRLIGVTRFSNHPPQAEAIARVGSYVQLDLEKIVALDPDICLATRDGNPRHAIVRLENLGIPVYVVHPRDTATVIEAIQGIAQVLGAVECGEALVGRMRHTFTSVRARLASTEQRPGVFFQVGITPIVSVGSQTFIDELISLAGGRNLAAGPVAYPRFSREQVLALDPDIILVTTMARDGSFEEALRQWQRWEHISAVRNGRLHTVDSNLFDRPGPRLTEALEVLFGLLHPEVTDGRGGHVE